MILPRTDITQYAHIMFISSVEIKMLAKELIKLNDLTLCEVAMLYEEC